MKRASQAETWPVLGYSLPCVVPGVPKGHLICSFDGPRASQEASVREPKIDVSRSRQSSEIRDSWENGGKKPLF